MAKMSLEVLAALAALGAGPMDANSFTFTPRQGQQRPPAPPHVRKGEKYPGQRTAYLIGTNNAHKRENP